jgi:hypothetical protein
VKVLRASLHSAVPAVDDYFIPDAFNAALEAAAAFGGFVAGADFVVV